MKQSYILRICVALLFIFSAHLSFSQKTVKTKGSAQVRMENNMTMHEVNEFALEKAIINAIENAFGTYAEQQFDMTIEDGITDYHIIGGTKIKGEWIETTNKKCEKSLVKEKDQFGERDIMYVTCSISGRAREIVPKANLVFITLNEPTKISRTTNFIDGEDLLLYFQSPVNGYLSVFIDDGEMVYRCLPYSNMRESEQNGVEIKRDKEYIFFSKEKNEYPSSEVDEIWLFTTKIMEYNYLYIVFSEDPFIKPILSDVEKVNNRILPKSLSPNKFQKWLEQNRASSTRFQDKKVKISIKAKE